MIHLADHGDVARPVPTGKQKSHALMVQTSEVRDGFDAASRLGSALMA
jgi:hypothetical protein